MRRREKKNGSQLVPVTMIGSYLGWRERGAEKGSLHRDLGTRWTIVRSLLLLLLPGPTRDAQRAGAPCLRERFPLPVRNVPSRELNVVNSGPTR